MPELFARADIANAVEVDLVRGSSDQVTAWVMRGTADVGVTPVFRFERAPLYLEAAIGLHLVQTHISAARVFSTAVQFGDHVGVGWRSGHWDFAARLQHLSNAGLDHPNPGINFVLVRAQYELH